MIPKRTNDDAVSPVVGVMLMIVVTVVIAAVVVLFSTGLVGDETSTAAPVVLIDVGILQMFYYDLDYVEFVHKGGDSFLLDDIEITLLSSRQLISNTFPQDRHPVTVSGTSGAGVVVTPGDIIKLDIDEETANYKYQPTEKVTWTIYHKKSDAVIANGVFIVPEKYDP